MENLISKLVSNKVQILFTQGLKQYVGVARLLRAFTKSLIAVQICFLGIQVGVLLLVIPLLVNSTGFSWISLTGGVIILSFASFLVIWNSEQSWTKRLHIEASLQSLEEMSFDEESRSARSS